MFPVSISMRESISEIPGAVSLYNFELKDGHFLLTLKNKLGQDQYLRGSFPTANFKVYEIDFRPTGSRFEHNESDILSGYKPYADPLEYFSALIPSSPQGKMLAADSLVFLELDNKWGSEVNLEEEVANSDNRLIGDGALRGI